MSSFATFDNNFSASKLKNVKFEGIHDLQHRTKESSRKDSRGRRLDSLDSFDAIGPQEKRLLESLLDLGNVMYEGFQLGRLGQPVKERWKTIVPSHSQSMVFRCAYAILYGYDPNVGVACRRITLYATGSTSAKTMFTQFWSTPVQKQFYEKCSDDELDAWPPWPPDAGDEEDLDKFRARLLGERSRRPRRSLEERAHLWPSTEPNARQNVNLSMVFDAWPSSMNRGKELDRALRGTDSPKRPEILPFTTTLGQPHLAFEGCGLTDSCVPELADLLQSSTPTPRYMSLRNNTLATRGIRQISDALWLRMLHAEPHERLEELDLSGAYFNWQVRMGWTCCDVGSVIPNRKLYMQYHLRFFVTTVVVL
jgi:hypothetical protein